jgi:hypothetical protein
VRAAAAEALGHTEDPRAIEPLRTLLEDSRPQVRRGAALALGHLGDTAAAPRLIKEVTKEDQTKDKTQPVLESIEALLEKSAPDLSNKQLNQLAELTGLPVDTAKITELAGQELNRRTDKTA